MHTLCPECKETYQISADELRNSQGMIRCTKCSIMFDALEFLDAKPVKENQKTGHDETHITLPAISIINKIEPYWRVGYFCCVALLIFQIYLFEGYNLTQNQMIRPWLLKSCTLLDCKLPRYKNLNELTILHGSFEATENSNYFFKAGFINQSSFAQHYPSIKLTLLDFTGSPFAERIFHPQDFLNQANSIIESEMSAEITMSIATPSTKIGGYRFEFI